MIRVVNVVQHYGVRPVLRGIDLEIPPGQLVAIVGPNGMGKSTLLKVMAGLLQPQAGYVEIDGRRRKSTVEDELAIRRRVCYLPDHPWLPKTLTGREFLAAVGRLYEIDDQRLLDHIGRLLQLFDLAAEGDWPISSYSNGQQKKIALASMLVSEAPVLMLDEPFAGGLDPAGILALKSVLQRLAGRDDMTVVLTTPVAELLDEIAQRVLVLRDGQIAYDDTPQGLRQQAGGQESMAGALEKLINPKTAENIEQYLRRQR
ncbi:MAG: ABC transporter ATP-binding protein [Planctomycetia bacterium]|nr:ABC transporter ATP-binding protein [Planctomycetia bacterium]